MFFLEVLGREEEFWSSDISVRGAALCSFLLTLAGPSLGLDLAFELAGPGLLAFELAGPGLFGLQLAGPGLFGFELAGPGLLGFELAGPGLDLGRDVALSLTLELAGPGLSFCGTNLFRKLTTFLLELVLLLAEYLDFELARPILDLALDGVVGFGLALDIILDLLLEGTVLFLDEIDTVLLTDFVILSLEGVLNLPMALLLPDRDELRRPSRSLQSRISSFCMFCSMTLHGLIA